MTGLDPFTCGKGRDPDPVVRRARRALLMVHEPHKRGYQRLRICPGLSPSGGYWRCAVTTASNTLRSRGAMTRDLARLTARCSTADGNRYFGWTDAGTDAARQLADRFIQRFRDICALGTGRDWAYAGWYCDMLGRAEQGCFPIACHPGRDPDPPGLHRVTGNGPQRLPLPPPGDAEDPADIDQQDAQEPAQ